MDWLNLKTSTFSAPEFIGSKPQARATWLSVSLWCALQENGGRVAGARGWKDRQWQQTCGITLKEVNSAPKLLTWDGDSLVVWNYPLEKEAEVQFNRTVGRNGGHSTSEAKRIAARINGAKGGRPKTQQAEPNNPNEPNENPSENPREGNGMEWEGKGTARGGLPNSLNTPRFSERWIRWQTHWSTVFNHGNPMPEMTAYQQLEDLAKIGEARAIAAVNNSLANGKLKKPAEPFTPNGHHETAAPARRGMTGADIDALPAEKFEPLS